MKEAVVYINTGLNGNIIGAGCFMYIGTEHLKKPSVGPNKTIATSAGFMLRKKFKTLNELNARAEEMCTKTPEEKTTDEWSDLLNKSDVVSGKDLLPRYIEVEKYLELSEVQVKVDTDINVHEILYNRIVSVLIEEKVQIAHVAIHGVFAKRFKDGVYTKRNANMNKQGNLVKEQKLLRLKLKEALEASVHIELMDSLDVRSFMGIGLAELVAEIGCNVHLKNQDTERHIVTEPDRMYWNLQYEVSPLMKMKMGLMNTDTDPNESIYYLNRYVEDVGRIGQEVENNSYGVVHLNKPDLLTEFIRLACFKTFVHTNNIVRVYYAELQREVHRTQLLHYEDSVITTQHSINRSQQALSHVHITNKDPERQIYADTFENNALLLKGIDHCIELNDWLEEYLSGDKAMDVELNSGMCYQDITDDFYVKTPRGVSKLTPDMPVGTNTHKTLMTRINRTVTFEMGLDMPIRNIMSALAKLHPRVILVSSQNEPRIYRYAIIIECDHGSAIYSNPDTCYIYNFEKRNKS